MDWHRYFNREYESPLPPRVRHVLLIVFVFVCAMRIFGILLDAAQDSQTFLALWVSATILGAVAGVAYAPRCRTRDASDRCEDELPLGLLVVALVTVVGLRVLYPAQFESMVAWSYNTRLFFLLPWSCASFLVAVAICLLREPSASPKGA